MSLPRDKYSIISQPNQDGTVDNGDSAFSTGLMAGSGSALDASLMPLFVKTGWLVRHPYSTDNTGTAPHNDPKATSRDQVVTFFFGAKIANNAQVNAACMRYARGWRINSDVLAPHYKLYLYKCAGEKPPLWLLILGTMFQTLSLLFDVYVKPDTEKNQSVAMNIVFGKPYITFLYKYHPNVFKNVNEYFCHWRQRCSIAAALNFKILESVGE